MRLLFVVKTMHFASGGAERVLACLCNGLSDRGHDVILATFDPPGSPSVYALDPAVDWIRLGVGDASARSTLRDAWRRRGALRRVVAGVGPDAAVGFMHSSSIPLALAALGSPLPVVFSEHALPAFYRDRPFEHALHLLSGLRAARIVVVSESYIPLYPRPIAARMAVIANPVAVLSGGRADVIGNGTGPKRLLAVGRLDAKKGHEFLIRAFGQIAVRHPEWVLRVVGDGPLRGDLDALATALGLRSRVEFPGRVEDIAEEYLRAQAFCVPSSLESFGIATAEALSLGLPAIGFADCPGTRALIRDGVNGILAPADDRIGGLAASLDRLLADGKLRACLAAEAPGIAERYRPEAFIDEWERLLVDVTARRGAGRL